MIRSSLSIYLSIYWLFAPSPNHKMCLLLPRVCFIQDISRDLFREDLGQIILLWEYILASIWRKTLSVLRSPFSTALWVTFVTVFGAPGLPRRNTFLKPFRFMLPSRGALRLTIEDFGGVWLQSLFLKRFCTIFGGVLDSENVDFAWEGFQKSQFHRSQNSTTFWFHFGGYFRAKIYLKWRLASPCAALGSHLDRFLGVWKFAFNKSYGNGSARLGNQVTPDGKVYLSGQPYD